MALLEDDDEPLPVPLTAQEFAPRWVVPSVRGRVHLGMSAEEPEVVDDADRYIRPEDREVRVLKCMRDAGEPVSARIIAKRLSMRRGAVTEALKRLMKANIVKRFKGWEPQWELVDGDDPVWNA